MHSYIEELKYSIPPLINIDSPDWLKTCLTTVVKKSVRLEGPTASEDARAFYKKMLDAIVVIVINYDSKSNPGIIGKRHTASLINLTHFRPTKEIPWSDDSDTQGQNHIEFFKSSVIEPRDVRLEGPRVEQLWFRRWRAYLAWRADAEHFTLNEVLLRVAHRPRPIFFSWFKDAEIDQETVRPEALLTPLSMNIDRALLDDTPGDGLPSSASDSVTRFVSDFSSMFSQEPEHSPREGIKINDITIGRMVRRLYDYFGNIGGSSFLSVPASVRVGTGSDLDNDLRAVVSVALKHDWDPEFYRVAWQFFYGMASQVLTDILVSEFVAFTRKKWEISTANAVYLASHPLKHRLTNVSLAASELRNDLTALLVDLQNPDGGDQPDPAELTSRVAPLKAKADLMLLSSEIATGYANFMNLLADLLDVDATDKMISESRDRNSQLSRSNGEAWKDVARELYEAASIARDARTGRRTVKLVGPTELRHLIPSRFCGGTLHRHAANEHLYYRTIFLELLQNAANYGLSNTGSHSDPVAVRITEASHGAGMRHLIIENAIDPMFVDQAKDRIDRIVAPKTLKQASGTVLAQELFKRLRLGELVFSLREDDYSLQGKTGSKVTLWRCDLHLRES